MLTYEKTLKPKNCDCFKNSVYFLAALGAIVFILDYEDHDVFNLHHPNHNLSRSFERPGGQGPLFGDARRASGDHGTGVSGAYFRRFKQSGLDSRDRR